jgi:hypothetical protein
MVEVIRKFGAGVYRLIAFHPKKENQPIGTPLPEIRQTTSEKQPSNADSLALLYREKRETTNRPTHHPVNTNERERIQITPPILKSERSQPTPTTPEPKPTDNSPTESEPMEISPEISEKIKTAGFKLNTTLATIVRSSTTQTVLEAIEATQQYQRNLQQRNQPFKREPEAILVAAIKDGWKSIRSTSENGASVTPDGFNEWFEVAREVGLVGISSAQADVTGHLAGVLCVRTVSGDWETFDQMRRLHSLAELQEIAVKQRSAMEFMPSPRLLALQKSFA